MRPSARRCDSRFVVAVGCVFALAAGGALAASKLDPVYSVPGSAGDEMGRSVCALGDVNGDKVPDFVVGAADTTNQKQGGYARVVSGADGSTIHTLSGNAADLFGYAVAAVPDTDGDGLDDVLVGAPYEFNGKMQTGGAHLYSGKDGSLLLDFLGDADLDLFGAAVTGLTDVDGDGLGDIAVGGWLGTDPSTGYYPGMTRVFSGKDGSKLYELYGLLDADEFGGAVTQIGDLDSDGFGELVVGAEYAYSYQSGYYTGTVAIFSGSSGKPMATIYGVYSYDHFGSAVAPAGDMDHDGTTDLLVGAVYGKDAGGNSPGFAEAFSGASWSSLRRVSGGADGDGFGKAVAGGQDLNADGFVDFAVGAPWVVNDAGATAGAVRWISGKDGTELDLVQGIAQDDEFGWAAALIGDLSGDGTPDTLVGIPGDDGPDDGSADNAGAVVVIGTPPSGPSGSVLIDGGETATASQTVTLTLSWAAGTAPVSEMRLRNESNGTWSDWGALDDSVTWDLAAGDASKTVEAQFRDENLLESVVVRDFITLDTVKPAGAVSVEGGKAWTNSADVILTLTYSDGGSGVGYVRLKNSTDASFTDWELVGGARAWTLASGAGSRTVSVEYKDLAGNVSSTASDAIGVDLSKPGGTFDIEAGEELVNHRDVSLTFSASDTGGSGVSKMRVRNAGAANWTEQGYTGAIPWTLPEQDGTREIEVQFVDVAGNESDVVKDHVVLDQGLPVIVSFALHAPQLYFLPAQVIGFDLEAADTTGGTGVTEARTTWDGGATWTDWTDISGGGVYTPDRPPLQGVVSAQVVVRDGAGNESERSLAVPLLFVDLVSPDIKSGGTSKGAMSDGADLDVIGLDLVKGDSLTVTVLATGSPKKQSFLLSLDLALADGTRYVTGKFPGNLKTPGIKGYVAPVTGRYLLAVRNADSKGTSAGKYTLTVSVKHAKANASKKGTAAAGEFTLDAAAGSTFAATLKGAGLDPASVTIEGPDGAVTVKTKVVKGVVNVLPVKFPATGTYTVRFTATGSVAFTWTTTLAKPNVKLKE